MEKRVFWITNLVVFSINVGIFLYMRSAASQVAVVRSAEVVAQYAGMKEAKSVYQNKVAQWQATLDSLSNQLELSQQALESERVSLSLNEKTRREAMLGQQEAKVDKYQAVIEKKAKEEEEKILQGALNQINSYIEAYALENNYSVVLGTTQTGNILYAGKKIDITEEVITGLNNNYHK